MQSFLQKKSQLHSTDKQYLSLLFIQPLHKYCCDKITNYKQIAKRIFPSQQRNSLCVERISELYQAQDKQDMEPEYLNFVRQPEDMGQLFKYYSIKLSSVKQRLREICQGYQPVRCDDNCFYTAFGYQFLKILLLKYNNQEYNQFIQFVLDSKIRFRIEYQGFQINDYEIEHQLLEEFLYRLQELRVTSKEKRLNVLFEQFSQNQVMKNNGEGYFYALATIFFRNLADYCIGQTEFKDLEDRENLLIWEAQFDKICIVIHALAQILHLNIILVLFEGSGIDFKSNEYFPQNKDKIILLIKLGLYNIGLICEQ